MFRNLPSHHPPVASQRSTWSRWSTPQKGSPSTTMNGEPKTPAAIACAFSLLSASFIAAHDQVFVVEQNRDAQLRSLLVNELVIDPARLIPVLHYDGTPITARFIGSEIAEKLAMFNVTPLRKVAP